MPKDKPATRKLVVECAKPSPKQGRHSPIPRIVIDLVEGEATLLRCPFQDIDIEIHDYDVPEDWNPENIARIEPTVETSMGTDVFGRRFQLIKFKRRSK